MKTDEEIQKRLSESLLYAHRWEFTIIGRDVVSKNFYFGKNGSIQGYAHPNESRWRRQDERLEIYDAEKKLSWSFRLSGLEGSPLLIGRYEKNASVNDLFAVLKAAGPSDFTYEFSSLLETARFESNVVQLQSCPSMKSHCPPCKLDRYLDDFAASSWDQQSIKNDLEIPGAQLWEIRDAYVYTRNGLVSTRNNIISESMIGFPGNIHASTELRKKESSVIELDTALYALNGNLENHFHFMIETLPRLWCFADLAVHLRIEAVIVPSSVTPIQGEIFAFCKARFPSLNFFEVGPRDVCRVGRLLYPHTNPAGSLFPNSCTLDFINRFSVAWESTPALLKNRLIYVSRRDSGARVLINEALLEAKLENLGFDIVLLSDMSVADQAQVFRSASLIVSPHGAGLSNIIFCRPGTRIIEVHMPHNANWVYRRICNVMGLPYDYVVGEMPSDMRGRPMNTRQYSVNIDSALEAIKGDGHLLRTKRT